MIIPWAKPNLGAKENRYLRNALASTWISGGPYVERLEREFLLRHRSRYGMAVSNGTTALQLALLALDIGPGDEVIVPGFTFVAPGNMVLAVGARPVFVEIDPEIWCVDPAAVERAVTPRTKAIIAVHIYGNVCDMDALGAIARRRGLFLVEDAAEAAFSRYKGRLAGTMGDIGCFSFQATKTITTGEGGFVLAKRKEHGDRMRLIANHGMRPGKRYWHDAVGHNFRLTNMQAAVGCAQLERLDGFVKDRARMARLYRKHLAGIGGAAMQTMRPEVAPVVWAIAVRLDPARFPGGRDEVMRNLAGHGIETRPGFYPFGAMPLYKSRRLPVCEAVGRTVISLPSFPDLSEREIKLVCDRLKALARPPR